jgi:selenocysteine lyase/cysteine desulfurase
MLRYADCMGTGQLDPEFESKLMNFIGPYYANTHSDSLASKVVSELIHQGRHIIKKAFVSENACDDFSVVFTGQGTTGATRHFAHLIQQNYDIKTVIYSDLEHLSNSAMWESVFPNATIQRISMQRDDFTLFNDTMFCEQIDRCDDGEGDILVAMTLCSNVFGSVQPVLKVLEHINNKNKNNKKRIITCVDCAACAPYLEIAPLLNDLFDGAVASVHKFKGGQCTPGILVLRKSIFNDNSIPFFPGGGVIWFRDKECSHFVQNIEQREEGGSRNMLGIIRASVLFHKKHKQQKQIVKDIYKIVKSVDSLFHDENITMLTNIGNNQKQRLPVYSFVVKNTFPSLFVQALSDEYGIQARSGVSCCFMIADHLCKMNINERQKLLKGQGPPQQFGWIRLSFHPSQSLDLIHSIIHDTIRLANIIHNKIMPFYRHIPCKNEWEPIDFDQKEQIQRFAHSFFSNIIN